MLRAGLVRQLAAGVYVYLPLGQRVLDRVNKTAAEGYPPYNIVREGQDAYRVSLAVAGESGTLSDRMRWTAAHGRCQAKTGTLDGVSNLAGYCTSRSGVRTAFAFLMSGRVWTSHPLQNKMAVALARYRR